MALGIDIYVYENSAGHCLSVRFLAELQFLLCMG